MSIAGAGRCLRCMEPTGEGDECPGCGWRSDDTVDGVLYAQPGTILSGRYLLGICLRKNGEGILYAGYDQNLQQKVWIREYFPQTIAKREKETGKVSPIDGCGAQYKALMSDFVDICNEIKRLGVTEPVVPLENVISENNTVYAIYKGLELTSFEDFLEKKGGKLKFRRALALLLPVCGALSVLHNHGQIHRGVSPFTIFVEEDGKKLYIWDFALSATRTAGSELDAELFSGFSAPEQYSPNSWQGSWTDIYAMAALLYRTLSGIVPPKSTRMDDDRPLASLEESVPGLPANISEAVRDAMITSIEDRTQTMQTFISRLAEPKDSGTAVYDTGKLTRGGRGGKSKPEPRHGAAVAGRQKSGTRAGIKDSMKSGIKSAAKPAQRRGGSGGAFKYVAIGTFAMLLLLSGVIWYFVEFIYPDLIGESVDGNVDPPSSVSEAPASQSSVPDVQNKVPDFLRRNYRDVVNDIEYQGKFNFSVREEFSDIFDAGVIYDQMPPAGNKISEGETTVILYVSKGPTTYQMPALTGYTLEAANSALKNIEGVRIEIFTRYEAGAMPGTVLGTMPEAGETFDPKRSTVYLFVMPEVSGAEVSNSPEPPPVDNIRPEDYYDQETSTYRNPASR